MACGIPRGHADDPFSGRIDQLDFAILIDDGDAIEGIIHNALHHRASMHRIQTLMEDRGRLRIDRAPQADGIGQQRHQNPGHGVENNRPGRENADGGCCAEDGHQRQAGEADAPGFSIEKRPEKDSDQKGNEDNRPLVDPIVHPVLYDGFKSKGLQDRSRHNPMDGHRELIAEFHSRSAHDYFFASHRFVEKVAPHHIDIG